MTREEQIERASNAPYYWNPEFQLRDDFNNQCKYYDDGFKAGAEWADKNPYHKYYSMKTCPNCRDVIFFNPCNNCYFIGRLDSEDNVVKDSEIIGKVSEYTFLKWTDLPLNN